MNPHRFHWMPALLWRGFGARYRPAIVDDFGNMVFINASNAWYSLLQYEDIRS